MQVTQDVIDWVNRWNIGEDDVVHGPMWVVYSEIKQMMETFLEFSLALCRPYVRNCELQLSSGFRQYDEMGD